MGDLPSSRIVGRAGEREVGKMQGKRVAKAVLASAAVAGLVLNARTKRTAARASATPITGG